MHANFEGQSISLQLMIHVERGMSVHYQSYFYSHQNFNNNYAQNGCIHFQQAVHRHSHHLPQDAQDNV